MARSTQDPSREVLSTEGDEGEPDHHVVIAATDPEAAKTSVDSSATLEEATLDPEIEVRTGPGFTGDAGMPDVTADDAGSIGGSSLLPDLGVGDGPGLDDVGTSPGSSLLDDLGGGSPPDATGGIGGADVDGWSQPVIDDPWGHAMDGGDFAYGTGPPDIGQWDTITSTTEETPTATVTETTWEPNVLPDDPEEGQSGGHGPEQPGGGTEAGTDDVWFANTLDPEEEEQEATSADSSDQVRQGPPEPDDEEDEQDQEEQDGGPKPQTNDGPEQGSGDSMPVPEEADYGNDDGDGQLDTSSLGGNVDPAFEAEAAGDAGDLIGGRGDIDYDPDHVDPGGAGALDHQLLGAVDPVGVDLKLDPGEHADLAEAFAPDDALTDLDVEIDDSHLDAAVGLEDAAG